MLFWQQHARSESLRRLHLAAQHGETLFFMFRPLAAARDPSPAPLRLSVRPAPGGINLGFVKRQGPQRDEELYLPMSLGPVFIRSPHRQEPAVTPVSAPSTARHRVPEPTFEK